MKQFLTTYAVAACLFCVSAIGCGGNDATAPSADAVANFVDENPQLVEEAEAAKAMDKQGSRVDTSSN